MSKFLILTLLFISINLFSYTTNHYGYGMCGEYANFQVSKSDFPSYWEPMIVEISKNAANWWNEAGSEHHLYYDGIGTSNPEIEYNDWCDSTALACTSWWVNVGCFSTSVITITVNSDDSQWLTSDWEKSFKMQQVLTHEMGHLLGLGHTDDSDDYEAIIMNTYSYPNKNYAHLTEDDKYGVRAIYGKDDQTLRVGSSSIYTYYPNNSPTIYASGNSDYQTYSKPQLVYQPNTARGYDYIAVWNKANTREINYRFVNDCGTNNNSICGLSGDTRHYIEDSETLTTPSIAVSDDGYYSVIAWKQETANKKQNEADDIWYSRIPTYIHSCQVDVNCGSSYESHKLFDNSGLANSDYSSFKAKTVSQPKVVWVNNWNRFVIFYTKLDEYSLAWRIAYIVSTDQYGNFSTNPTVHYLEELIDISTPYGNLWYLHPLKSNWNPMAINCNQTYDTTKKACLLVFNEINTDTNTSYADNVAKTTYKILEPSTVIGSFSVQDITKTGDWDRKGYGHYSIASREFTNLPAHTVNLLNRITKSAKEVVNNLRFVIYKSGTTWHGDTISNHTSSTSYYSRTGYSMVFNPVKQIYKYFWIQE